MKKISLIIVCIVMVTAVAVSLVGCDEEEFTSKPLSAQWMGQLDDSSLLSSISIPGSHDSGSIRKGGIFEFSHTQNLTIEQQLLSGVRFFDIRLGFKKGKLGIYHGFLYQKVTFDDVIKVCKDFLAAHPTETILMSIKHEHGDSVTTAVVEKIQEEPSLWYTANSNPTLGQVRGKIVLFNRIDGAQQLGIDLNGMGDNCTSDVNNGVPIHVQDYYNVGKKKNLYSEWEEIQACFEYAKTAPQGTFVINFTSCYYPLIKGLPLPLIPKSASYIRGYLDEYYKTATGFQGIVLIDFVDEAIAESIYNLNS